MCEITTALAIGTSVLGFISDTQRYNAQSKAIEDNYSVQQEAIAARQKQFNANAQDEASKRAREATIERGRLRTIQGESGLTGNTQGRIIGESYFNEGRDIASIEANRRNEVQQLHTEANGLRAQSQSQLNTLRQPSLIGTGLQIGTALAISKGTKGYRKP